MSMEAGKAWESPGGALLRRTDGMGIKKTPMHTHGRSYSGAGNRI